MPGPAESRKRSLELSDFRTVDELAMGEHAGHRLIDGFAEPAAPRGGGDKWDGVWTQVLVHGALQGLIVGHQLLDISAPAQSADDAARPLAGGGRRGLG